MNSDKIWPKLSYLFGLIPLGLLFGAVAFVAGVEIKDLDLWLHLAMGRFIAQHGFIPTTDVLSFTIAGAPWNNHEWLFQLIVYHLYHAFGPQGLIQMQVVLVTVTMGLLFVMGYQREKLPLVTFLLLLVFLVFQQRFTIRPDLYSLFFFSVYILVLSAHLNKAWALPVLFGTQVLWTNMHGFFFFGPLCVFLGLMSEAVKRRVPLPAEWNRVGRLTDEEYGRIKKIFIFVILACLINPQGLAGAWYPIKTFFSLSKENKIFFSHIQELQAPVSWGGIFEGGRFVYYKLLIFLSGASFIFNRRRIDISALLLWLVFLIFSLKAARNTTFFAFAAYLVTMTNASYLSLKNLLPLRFTASSFGHLTLIVVNMLMGMWILMYCQSIARRGYFDFDRYQIKSIFGGVTQQSYPNKAVDFLVENHIRGRFFNDFNSGAYLLGRAYPAIRVFIDGRTEVYGGAFFKEYQKVWARGDGELFDRMARRYRITGALLSNMLQRVPRGILRHLYQSKDWIPVYFNYDAVVFLRDIPMNQKIIRKFALDLSRWRAPEIDTLRLGVEPVSPYQPYYRAFLLEAIDADEPAMDELRQAMRIDPAYLKAHELLGKLYAKKQAYQEAFDHFRVVAAARPMDKQVRYNLALACLDMKEYAEAKKHYKAIMTLWPKDPKAYFLLTKTLVMAKEFDEVLPALQKAKALAPRAKKDFLRLGDLLLDAGQYDLAGTVYRLAVVDGKPDKEIEEKLRRVRQKKSIGKKNPG